MKASEGSLSHSEIMALSWRQFHVYLESFTWLLQEETDKGRAKNRLWDLQAMAQEPSLRIAKESMLEETKRIVARHIAKKVVNSPRAR